MAEEEQVVGEQVSEIENQIVLQDNLTPLSSWLKVQVKEPTKRENTTLKLQDSYVEYLVEAKIVDRSGICSQWLEEESEDQAFPDVLSTWRRYSEFDLLRDYLIVIHPTLVIPPLPEKRSTSAWQAAVVDKTDPEFIERRRIALEQFLTRLTQIAELSQDTILLGFLKNEHDWKESVNASNYRALKNSKISSLSASYRIKRPNEKFEVVKKYASDLENHIGNVLKTRAKTAEHLYGIHKIHANYGREFSQWSTIERTDMAEGLQKIGHYIDTFAQDIDVAIESEEDFADQLKEYYGYCDSLKNICKKQEIMQLELEKAEDALESKRTERENYSLGKTGVLGGLKARVFGGVSAEQKEAKLKLLDEQILDAEERVKTLQESLESYENAALANVEKFHQQKNGDIIDILINFMIMTLDRCKKSRATWVNIQETCESI